MKKVLIIALMSLVVSNAQAFETSTRNPTSACCDCPTKTCQCYNQMVCGIGQPIRQVDSSTGFTTDSDGLEATSAQGKKR